MDAWQPPPLPNGQKYVDLLSTYRTKPFLDWTYSKLLEATERGFSPRTGQAIFDDFADFIETWIRNKLRTWKGDLSEFKIYNSKIAVESLLTHRYFQAVNRIICKDEEYAFFYIILLLSLQWNKPYGLTYY